ncbi:MAG TPA: hypothetical protein VGS22_28915 [Thermoanaerobaculia bacterium]|jgi:hypothetical protein|nr:hypothetical protein [Thermoanaerobaculia bacterium]
MKTKVIKVRMILNLEVVRGKRWRELSPFREAVLFHFTPPALRDQVIVLSEAVVDKILEEVTDVADFGEPDSRAHLRAVIADLQHDRMSLREVVASHPDEMEALEDRESFRLALRLAKYLERALANLERLIGPAPSSKTGRHD